MPIYATEAEYLTRYGAGEPEPPARYLEAASDLVYDALKNDIYAVDTDELPTHPQHLAAVKKATLQQVRLWVTENIDPELTAASEANSTVTSASLLGGSYSVDPAKAAEVAKARVWAAQHLATVARRTLRHAGLGSITVSYA